MPICTPYIDTSNGRITVHTSSTRPSTAATGLYPGKYIYESDTGRTLLWDGTGWVIQNEPSNIWTPSMSGTTLGNGSITGVYKRGDGWVDYTAAFTLGSTSAVAGPLLLNLPITASASNVTALHTCNLVDASANSVFPTAVHSVSTTQVQVQAVNTALAAAVGTAITNLVPFTWTTSDTIVFAGRYQMTTRYS